MQWLIPVLVMVGLKSCGFKLREAFGGACFVCVLVVIGMLASHSMWRDGYDYGLSEGKTYCK